MAKTIDMVGMKFGKLTVIERRGSDKSRACWLCMCECGNTCIVKGKYLRNGDTKSCGCIVVENAKQNAVKNIKRNNIYIKDDVLHIKFHNSKKEFICDASDYGKVVSTTWHVTKYGYARGNINGKMIFFHDYIMGISLEDGLFCDHINGDRLDNRKCNLRKVTSQQNSLNKSVYVNNSTGHKGVHKSQNKKKWIAVIGKDGRQYHLGTFNTFDEAVSARKSAEDELFGEYRRLDAS